MILKGLGTRLEELEIRGQAETTQQTRILRRILETWGDLLLRLQWKTIF